MIGEMLVSNYARIPDRPCVYFVSPAICASDGSITWRYHRVDPSLQPKSTILMLCPSTAGKLDKTKSGILAKTKPF